MGFQWRLKMFDFEFDFEINWWLLVVVVIASMVFWFMGVWVQKIYNNKVPLGILLFVFSFTHLC